VCGVDGQRRQNREDLLIEHPVENRAVVLIELVPVRQVNAGRGQIRDELCGEDCAPPLEEVANACADRAQLRPRRLLAGAACDSRLDLHLQAADAYLEELVQVLAEDREELGPLQDRQRTALRERKHMLVEVEPGELSVQEAVGALGKREPPLRGSCRSRAARDRKGLFALQLRPEAALRSRQSLVLVGCPKAAMGRSLAFHITLTGL
jgi:hypothetical protein